MAIEVDWDLQQYSNENRIPKISFTFLLVIKCKKIILTWPLSSIRLFVSFNLSKEIICFIHCAPFAGESG